MDMVENPKNICEISNIVAVLKACAKQKDVHKGTRIHKLILKTSLLTESPYVGSALVSMYAKCGTLAKAEQVLYSVPIRNVVLWSAMIDGCTLHGKGKEALKCYEQMLSEGFVPDTVTYICVLKACGSIDTANKGCQFHNIIMMQGLLGKDIVLDTTLVDMYAKCGALSKAACLLDDIPVRDVVAWNALISGHVEHKQGKKAIYCYEQIQYEGLIPNVVTFICVLKACGSIGTPDKGRQLHEEIVRQELLGKDDVLGNSLVDMYVKCGAIPKAAQIVEELPFRGVITWNTLITGHVQHGLCEAAMKFFEMMQSEGVSPNTVTFIGILKACGSIGAADKGEKIYNNIVGRGLLGKDIFLDTTVLDMFARCGALDKATNILRELPVWDVVTWNALISGYTQQEQCEEALTYFEWMHCHDLLPDRVTFICILKACGSVGAAERGEHLHNEIIRMGLLKNDLVLGNALLDMYVKCGALAKAAQVFDDLLVRDVVTWNALMAGYAEQGLGEAALCYFERMICEGLSPDTVTLVCVLCACSHKGLLEKGQMHFANMSRSYGISPLIDHHLCMADLFGRAGELDAAFAVIKNSPCSSKLLLWCGLLGACLVCGNVKVAKLAFDNAMHIDKNHASAYILMSNIYAAIGMEEDAKNVATLQEKMQMPGG